MAKPRRLNDLYVVGKEVVFDDGQGDPVVVWLQKISPLDHENALRRANQVRAKILARLEDDSAEYDIAYQEADAMSQDMRVEYLVLDELQRHVSTWEAEIAAEEEWSKDNYIVGLRDIWEEEMSRRYLDDPEDEEALHVFNEIKRFNDVCSARIESEKDSIRDDIASRPEEQVLKAVVEKFLSNKGDIAWLSEFRKSEIWLSVREPKDHHKRYFPNRTDIDELSEDVLVRLLTEYKSMAIEPLEGKSSEEATPSSESSEQPEKVETDDPSGLVGAVG